MKTILSFLLTTIFYLQAIAQKNMIVDQKGGLVYYGSTSKTISNLSQLPPAISEKARFILTTFMGDFSKNTHFLYGQLVDLQNNDYVSKNYPINSNIPRYDLEYALTDPSIGIKSFPVNIRFDSSGKLLKITWPKQGYTTAESLMPRDTIRNFALKQAVNLNFNLDNYQVEFRYDEDKQKFYWRFLFIGDKGVSFSRFNVINVNWSDKTDFFTENIVKTLVR